MEFDLARFRNHGNVFSLPREPKLVEKCKFKMLKGVLDRLSQVEPKILFSVEAVIYNQKKHDHLQKLQEVVKSKLYTVGHRL